MARKEQFEQVVKELNLSEEDKATMLQLGEKTPAFMDAVLRQSDYDRFMNENKAKIDAAGKWDDWAKTNLNRYNELQAIDAQTGGKLHEYPVLMKERDDLKTKLDALTSGKEFDMTQEQLTTAVAQEFEKRGIRNPTEQQINEMVTKVSTDIINTKAVELEKTFVTQTLPSHMNFMADVLDAAQDFRTEFGEKMNRDEFVKYCAANQQCETVGKAYEQYVAVRRLEKKHADELKQADEKARKEERDKLANQNLPGSTSAVNPTGTEPGPVLQFIRGQNAGQQVTGTGTGTGSGTGTDAGAVAAPGALGDGSAAAAAAAALRASGKF